jgi:hypothetical protein
MYHLRRHRHFASRKSSSTQMQCTASKYATCDLPHALKFYIHISLQVSPFAAASLSPVIVCRLFAPGTTGRLAHAGLRDSVSPSNNNKTNKQTNSLANNSKALAATPQPYHGPQLIMATYISQPRNLFLYYPS